VTGEPKTPAQDQQAEIDRLSSESAKEAMLHAATQFELKEARKALDRMKKALTDVASWMDDGRSCFCDIPKGHQILSHEKWCINARKELEEYAALAPRKANQKVAAEKAEAEAAGFMSEFEVVARKALPPPLSK
jgi:hypothetical protein